jgi:Asp-tRNA(Asn)/Glu-tRNA(Gln) amidotransferase A subunit family amidase
MSADAGVAALRFVEEAGMASSGPAMAAPAAVALPVRERMRLIRAGDMSTAEWHADADEWSYAADARYRACVELRTPGRQEPPVRVGVKDTVDVAGFATRLGLRRYRHHPRRSAVPLRGLSNVTVNAKVVTTELNIGLGSGCGNPYFPQIDPAGSSTGSAVAVAAGICDLSLGTDVLGSVRWPAGRCGVVGLRTTHDEHRLGGVFPLSPAMDAPGWVARTADDLAFLWRHVGLGGVAAGHSARPPVAPRRRVGVVREVFEADVEAEILGSLDIACSRLTGAGHTVERLPLGAVWGWRGAAWELCARDAWDGYKVWRQWIADDLLKSTRAALEAGARVSDRRYAEIRGALWRQRAEVSALFAGAGVDAWLLPLDPDVPQPRSDAPGSTSTIPAPDDAGYDREVGFTPIASFLGLPAITFPVGRSHSGQAPLAMQLVGRPHAETTLIQLAQEMACGVEDLGQRPSARR